MATDLCVVGPVDINCQREGLKKHIGESDVQRFFESEDFQTISRKQGGYVFALRAALGFTPWYVGKTTKSMILL